jgi:hypothetical protein
MPLSMTELEAVAKILNPCEGLTRAVADVNSRYGNIARRRDPLTRPHRLSSSCVSDRGIVIPSILCWIGACTISWEDLMMYVDYPPSDTEPKFEVNPAT